MTPLSGNVRFMQIFTGVPSRGVLNDSEVVNNGNIQCFRYLSSEKKTLEIVALSYDDSTINIVVGIIILLL